MKWNKDELSVKSWEPKTAKPGAPIVIAIHGMASHAGYFFKLGEALVQKDVSLYAIDRRGNGLARDFKGSDNPRQVIDDVKQVVLEASKQTDKVILLTWCFGARIGIPAAAELNLAGLFLCTPGIALQKRINSGYEHSTPKDGYIALPFDPTEFATTDWCRNWIKNDQLTLRKVTEGQVHLKDKLGEMMISNLAHIKCPKLCVLATEDVIVNNSGVRQKLDQIGGYSIEERPGGHAIILEDSEWLANRVVRFIQSEAKPLSGANRKVA